MSESVFIPENKNGHCWHNAALPDGGVSSQFFTCCHCGNSDWARRELVPPEGHGPHHPHARPGDKWLFDGNEEVCVKKVSENSDDAPPSGLLWLECPDKYPHRGHLWGRFPWQSKLGKREEYWCIGLTQDMIDAGIEDGE